VGNYGAVAQQAPSEGAETDLLAWISEHVSNGESFLKKQIGYNLADPVAKLLMEDDRGDPTEKELSDIVDNEFGSLGTRLAALLTDLRPFLEFKTQNQAFQSQADTANYLMYNWWFKESVDQVFVDAVKLCLVAGSSYVHTEWDPSLEDFVPTAVHPHDVLPMLPRRYHDTSTWFGAIVREELPTSEVKRRWPSFKHKIIPDVDASTGSDQAYASRVNRAADMSPFARYAEFLRKAVANYLSDSMPVTFLYTTYFHDQSRNTTDRIRLMGPWRRDEANSRDIPLTNWSYEVKPGEKLYPFGRTIKATRHVVLYDGPSQYWYGMMGLLPVDKLVLDEWPVPRGFLGKSPLWAAVPLQRALNRAHRAIDDHMNHFVEPDIVVDGSVGMSKKAVERINPRRAGGRFMRRPGPGKGFEFNYPAPLPAEILNRPQFLIERMGNLVGLKDIDAMMKMGQVPSADTIDQFLASTTYATRSRSRSCEVFMRSFAKKMFFNFAQYYTVAQKIAICGPKGVTPEDFDFDPGSFVPDHLGSDYDKTGELRDELIIRNDDGIPIGTIKRPEFERVRELQRYIAFTIAPGTLLDQANMGEKMAYMQFYRMGIMDPWTLFEKWNVPNAGDPPNGERSVTDRLQAALAMGITGQVSAAGRKSSGQQVPQQRSSGAISESG